MRRSTGCYIFSAILMRVTGQRDHGAACFAHVAALLPLYPPLTLHDSSQAPLAPPSAA